MKIFPNRNWTYDRLIVGLCPVRYPAHQRDVFVFGGSVFWFYGRQRTKKDFALLHLIERVAAREFVDVSLETELKEIIHERDENIKDWFDRVIEESIVLDIEETISSDELCKIVSEKMSQIVVADKTMLKKALVKREEQCSTVLRPGLAIPHIVIEGEHIFSVLLARCKPGIIFPGAEKKVQIVFVLIGTRDERSFHLRALSAIAQITQDPSFDRKWIEAEDKEALRNIILFSKRKRH